MHRKVLRIRQIISREYNVIIIYYYIFIDYDELIEQLQKNIDRRNQQALDDIVKNYEERQKNRITKYRQTDIQ